MKTYPQYARERGEFAYETFRKMCAVVDASALPMTEFSELPEALQAAWIEAASAICRRYQPIL